MTDDFGFDDDRIESRPKPVHGYGRDRINPPYDDGLEAAFARAWDEQQRHSMPDVLCRSEQLTRNGRVLAATMIQWLGTNVGFSFLCEVLRKKGYVVAENYVYQQAADRHYKRETREPGERFGVKPRRLNIDEENCPGLRPPEYELPPIVPESFARASQARDIEAAMTAREEAEDDDDSLF